jgi:hypothetical protein
MAKKKPPRQLKENVDFETLPVKGPLLAIRVKQGKYSGTSFYYEYIKFVDDQGQELHEDSDPQTAPKLSYDLIIIENPDYLVEPLPFDLLNLAGDILITILEIALTDNTSNTYSVLSYSDKSPIV